MSGRGDRSLELAWGVGVGVAVVAAGLTLAADRGAAGGARAEVAARSGVAVAKARGAGPLAAPPSDGGGAGGAGAGASTGDEATVDGAPARRLELVRGGPPAVVRGGVALDASRDARGAPPHHYVTPSTAAGRHRILAPRSGDARDRQWADSVLATLSLRAKIGQLFLRWIPGTFRDTTARDFAEARRWIAEDSIGGFIISIGSPAELAAKTNALQRLSRVPLFFAADLEFGPGQRLIPGGAVFPPPMGIAAAGDTALSCAHGRVTAEQARAVGIRWAFAPDVDVNGDPANPIVNTRAYSDRPELVARFAVPFIRCAESAGLLTTAKHFAAHGEAHVDSHIATPVVSLSRPRLEREALAPFRAARRAGVSAIMSAHVALPALSGDSVPASLNPRVLRRIVRDEWGFDGLVVTDALWMGGATKAAADPGQLAVRAIRAGNDVILDPADHRAMMAALEGAVRAGTISRARLDSSVRRVLIAKSRAGLAADRFVDERAVPAAVPAEAADSAASLAARRSLVFARGSAATSPLLLLKRGDTVAVFAYLDEGAQPAPGVQPGVAFVDALRGALAARGVAVDATLWTARDTPDAAALAARARGARAVVLAPYVRPLALKGTIDLSPAAATTFRAILLARPDAAVVSFGDPYLERQLPGLRTHLLAWNPWSAWAERAAARVLVGEAPAPGALPITLAEGGAAARLARDPSVLVSLRDSVRQVLDRAVAGGAFPGALAVVGTRDRVLASYAAGRIDGAAGAPAPDDRTLWDLASLTKVIGTTSAMMQLVGTGKVSLDAPVQRYLPRWTGAGKERVTVRHLLTHSSGLPAFKQYFREVPNPGAASRDTMLALIYATPLEAAPGARMVYSDFGAILLGEIVEKVSGQRLDAYLAQHVFAPLGMKDTRYLPVGVADASRARLVARAAPTEVDRWRGRHLRGEVHDENAYALGGVSGHAGLFSTAPDLTRFAQALLNRGRLGAARVFNPETVDLFTTRADPAFSSRALGWDTPTGTNSAGHLLSPRAFGHTGFTGTSLWVDPANGVFVLLLTNRVNPSRENTRIGDVRVALADAVIAALRPDLPAAPASPKAAAPASAPATPTRATP